MALVLLSHLFFFIIIKFIMNIFMHIMAKLAMLVSAFLKKLFGAFVTCVLLFCFMCMCNSSSELSTKVHHNDYRLSLHFLFHLFFVLFYLNSFTLTHEFQYIHCQASLQDLSITFLYLVQYHLHQDCQVRH